jgi:hypothetical protein
VIPPIAALLASGDVLLMDADLRWLPLFDLLAGSVPAPIDPAAPSVAQIDAARAVAAKDEHQSGAGLLPGQLEWRLRAFAARPPSARR